MANTKMTEEQMNRMCRLTLEEADLLVKSPSQIMDELLQSPAVYKRSARTFFNYGPADAPKRFRLVQDDDGHFYIIPADAQEKFDLWVAWSGDLDAIDGDQVEYPDFDSMRLDGDPSRVTFVDPKEDD